ncbi:hypothetical protein K443DRAFT_15258 [Laccaria amethystina LaAM-08-1]|uniref:Uncharacterized protein n=1 Tax=Laccaria amethystina LaAM-08-1 TaxID=1095629 RepID=A0A0C9WYH2_9AGAR|nr:hypothetical protein K443DRAFT_15258 [Laccaria amethystina LaAM-08-1]
MPPNGSNLMSSTPSGIRDSFSRQPTDQLWNLVIRHGLLKQCLPVGLIFPQAYLDQDPSQTIVINLTVPDVQSGPDTSNIMPPHTPASPQSPRYGPSETTAFIVEPSSPTTEAPLHIQAYSQDDNNSDPGGTWIKARRVYKKVRGIKFADDSWAPHPPPEDVYECLEEFFREHDLDKLVIEARLASLPGYLSSGDRLAQHREGFLC